MQGMLLATIDRLARKIDFVQKKHLKVAYFGGHKSGLPDLRRTWMPNGWHQVNFWGTPENFGVWRFKIAMWKVGGTEIERTRARNIFFCQDTEIREKAFFPAHHNFLKDRTDRTEWEWTLVLNVKISQGLE